MTKEKSYSAGFTLVEMIIYVAIFSIIFSMVLVLFGRIQISGNRSQLAGDIKESASQAVQVITYHGRQAEGLDGGSVLGSHPSTLILSDTEDVTIDTYSKNVQVGGEDVSILKLRAQVGADPAVDLTSDHVNVDNFVVTNLAESGKPDSLQIELELSTVNPSGHADYDDDISVRTAVSLRKEL